MKKVAIRIFYSSKTGRYYLLHAFLKKSDKTPLKELRIAKEWAQLSPQLPG